MAGRIKTKYPGIFYRTVKSRCRPGKLEKVYYLYARVSGKVVEERIGKEFEDNMTPAAAAAILHDRMQGKRKSPKEIREEAKAKATQIIWTIDRLWEEYKAHRSENAASFRSDTCRYDKYLKEKFGNTEPVNLIQLDMDRLRLALLKKSSPQTVKHTLALLRRIINFGVDRGLCSGPGFKIKLPRVQNLKTEDLTPAQLQALLAAINEDDNEQAKALMRLVLVTGMRRGELFKLQWRDVDFDRGFIHIRSPKGGVDQKIPLNDGARQILEDHPRSSEYVFPGRGGAKRTDFNHQMRRIADRAGLPKDFRPLHGLRHYFASSLASSGHVDLYTLQRLLTHKSPQMTQRYAHLRDETLQKASAHMSNIINGGTAAAAKVVNMHEGEK
ncbi:MAG: tyrosine-type recombinase/integrase [Thermoleophilia bacterium]